jgi:hypothetical protein
MEDASPAVLYVLYNSTYSTRMPLGRRTRKGETFGVVCIAVYPAECLKRSQTDFDSRSPLDKRMHYLQGFYRSETAILFQLAFCKEAVHNSAHEK